MSQMIPHYYCMACGLLLPPSARSPTSPARLQCPHCHCEMELPSLPATPTLPPHNSSPATPGASSSSSSIFSYADSTDVDPTLPLTLKPLPLLSSTSELSKSKKDEEAAADSDDDGDGGEGERDNSKGRRSKKGKKRDPHAPKRASNAYMLFCKEQRPLLKVRQPELHFSSIGQILGEMWRTLPLDDKRPYEERAADDRDRYKAQMQHYNTAQYRHSTGGVMEEGGYSGHSSPSMMSMNPGHLPFPFPPSSSSSSVSSSPFATFPPGPRYQPYPTHNGGYPDTHMRSPPSSMSQSSPSAYASIKRSRLDRASMSESEYFSRLYQFQMQQQAMINEDIRKYGRQRTSSYHNLPPMHSPHHQQMPDMGLPPPHSSGMGPGSALGSHGGGGLPLHSSLMGGPPSYSREESLSGLSEFGGTSHGYLQQQQQQQQQPPHQLPSFFNGDLDQGAMDDLDFAHSGPARHPHHWGGNFDAQAMH